MNACVAAKNGLRVLSPLRFLLLGVLYGYRVFMSPYVGGGCRFDPSCSLYAAECVRRFGAILGMWLTIRRLLRCQPEHPCGLDPVPSPEQIRDALEGRLFVDSSHADSLAKSA